MLEESNEGKVTMEFVSFEQPTGTSFDEKGAFVPVENEELVHIEAGKPFGILGGSGSGYGFGYHNSK
jgi:hypothetical protein